MTSGRHIDYDALAQDALRGVVRAVLQKVSATGLLGEHHFYIAFNTQAPGVNISRRLKERYPVEMTIVLQHRFWGLEVSEDKFEVKLTFDGIPERLVIPFKAVKVFYDPSVPYGLPFEESELLGDASRRGGALRPSEDGDGQLMQDDSPREPRAVPERSEKRPRTAKRPRGEAKGETAPAEAAKPAGKPASSPADATPLSEKPHIAAVKPEEPEKSDPGGAKVFDLSKFRKK